MINSPGCCRPLNGLFAVIGIDFYPTQDASDKFAIEPFWVGRFVQQLAKERRGHSKICLAKLGESLRQVDPPMRRSGLQHTQCAGGSKMARRSLFPGSLFI